MTHRIHTFPLRTPGDICSTRGTSWSQGSPLRNTFRHSYTRRDKGILRKKSKVHLFPLAEVNFNSLVVSPDSTTPDTFTRTA